VYTRKSRLSKAKRLRLLEHFIAGTTARAAAVLVGMNCNTVNRFCFALRTIVAEEMEKVTPLYRESLYGEVEVGESYFGGRRKSKRGRGAAGKVPVFGTTLDSSIGINVLVLLRQVFHGCALGSLIICYASPFLSIIRLYWPTKRQPTSAKAETRQVAACDSLATINTRIFELRRGEDDALSYRDEGASAVSDATEVAITEEVLICPRVPLGPIHAVRGGEDGAVQTNRNKGAGSVGDTNEVLICPRVPLGPIHTVGGGEDDATFTHRDKGAGSVGDSNK